MAAFAKMDSIFALLDLVQIIIVYSRQRQENMLRGALSFPPFPFLPVRKSTSSSFSLVSRQPLGIYSSLQRIIIPRIIAFLQHIFIPRILISSTPGGGF